MVRGISHGSTNGVAAFLNAEERIQLPSSPKGMKLNKPLVYSISDATQVLGIGRTTLYQLIKDGKITSFKLGARTFIRHEDLVAFVEQCHQEV